MHSMFSSYCVENANGECSLLKSNYVWVHRKTESQALGWDAQSCVGTKKGQLWPRYRPRWISTPICISLLPLFLSSSSLHSLRLVSSPWGHLLFPGSLQSKRDNLCDDLSTSQGGGRKHSNDQCFCNLYNRATNPYNSTASLPASKSGRRWHGRSHRSHWNLARSSFLPTLFSPCQPQHNVLAPTT